MAISLKKDVPTPSEETSCRVLPKKYRAKIDSVYPIKNRDIFESFDKCFLGISLENSNFRTTKLEAMVEWTARRFSNCVVLIGDSIHRLTLQSTKQLDPNNSLRQALEMGEEFVVKNKYIFDRYSSITNFIFLTCHTIQQTTRYEYFHRKIVELAETDFNFYRSVVRFSENYHYKNSKEIDTLELNVRIKTSIKYFLEEFSIFACLYQDGHQVMVYPGEFSTLSEITNGLHQGAPDELKQLTVVSLCLKGR